MKGSESAQKNASAEERIVARSKETVVTEAASAIAAAEESVRADMTTASSSRGISGFAMFMIASGISAAAAIGFVVIKDLLHV